MSQEETIWGESSGYGRIVFSWRLSATDDWGHRARGMMQIGVPGLTTVISSQDARRFADDLVRMADIVDRADATAGGEQP